VSGWILSLLFLLVWSLGIKGGVLLRDLIGGFGDWSGNIEGIDSKRLLNLMINKGVFER
jgi:hypothetical protein